MDFRTPPHFLRKVSSYKFGSEQKRPGANRPPEFVPESPLQKGFSGVIFLQGIIGKTHTQNLQNLREDTLGPLARTAPFVYFRQMGGVCHANR